MHTSSSRHIYLPIFAIVANDNRKVLLLCFKVDRNKDEVIEKEFNRILEAAAYIAHTIGVTESNGKPLSLGETVELLFK